MEKKVSRVGIPLNEQEEKSITVQATNPDMKRDKLLHDFIVIWDKINERVKTKTGKFFKIHAMECRKGDLIGISFKVIKGTMPHYQLIMDSLQEMFPLHGIRIVSLGLSE